MLDSPRNDPEWLELNEQFKAGTYIFRTGDKGDHMYIIQEGQVAILAEVGGVEKQLALLAEGDFFGEMAILEELPRTASARAVTSCSLLRIDRQMFDQLIRQDPEIAVRMLRKLSHRLRQVQPQGEEMPLAPESPVAQAPGAYFLLHKPSGTRFPLAATQENTLGRQDPVTGLTPAVDMGALDSGKTISRRHAVLFSNEGSWYLREEVGVRNGTFVNGIRLTPGQVVPINPGDILRFGRVEVVFQVLRPMHEPQL